VKGKSYNQAYFERRNPLFSGIKSCFYVIFIKLFLRPKNLLDVGCAEGKLVKWALKWKIEALGVDISSQGFVKAKPIVQARCQIGDILKLPFKNSQFEVVTCLALMEHIEVKRTDFALKELLRVSQKYVLLQICVKDNPFEGKHYLLDSTHVNVKKSNWWTTKLKNLNLEVSLALPKLGLFLIKKK